MHVYGGIGFVCPCVALEDSDWLIEAPDTALSRNPLSAVFPFLGRYAADAYSVGFGYDIALLIHMVIRSQLCTQPWPATLYPFCLLCIFSG